MYPILYFKSKRCKYQTTLFRFFSFPRFSAPAKKKTNPVKKNFQSENLPPKLPFEISNKLPVKTIVDGNADIIFHSPSQLVIGLVKFQKNDER